MRIRDAIVAAGLFSMTAVTLAPREARAQVTRDKNWDIVSNVTMAIGAGVVTLTPRIYYNDPEATVGWKGRWHVSVLAPAMTMTALTLLVDIPIRGAVKSARPGCNDMNTNATTEGCKSFGGPSTQAYASWGATGAGTGIFLVDTIKYSNQKFSVPSFLLNVILPLSLSAVTTIGRAVEPGEAKAFENGGQIAAGALTGFGSGLIIGGTYALLQRPACPYGNSIFCW